jgi:hypothetical protein
LLLPSIRSCTLAGNLGRELQLRKSRLEKELLASNHESPRRCLLGNSGIGSLGLQLSDCSIYYKLGKEAFLGP